MKVKTSIQITLSCPVFNGLIAMLFMTLFRNAWAGAFTADTVILSLTGATMPVLGLCELGNCPQTTVSGALRGSARPSLVANINFGSFYGVGLPIALLLGFYINMGLLGICLDLLVAQVVCAFAMALLVMRMDWELQANRSRELIGVEDTGNHQDLEELI